MRVGEESGDQPPLQAILRLRRDSTFPAASEHGSALARRPAASSIPERTCPQPSARHC